MRVWPWWSSGKDSAWSLHRLRRDPDVHVERLVTARLSRAMVAAGVSASIDPCGENGEFHTCVAAGPMFSHPLDLRPGDVVQREGFVYADLVLGSVR